MACSVTYSDVLQEIRDRLPCLSCSAAATCGQALTLRREVITQRSVLEEESGFLCSSCHGKQPTAAPQGKRVGEARAVSPQSECSYAYGEPL